MPDTTQELLMLVRSHNKPAFFCSCKLAIQVLCICCLLLGLVACSSSSTSTTVSSHATTPATHPVQPATTQLPKGTVLYQANWSHGLAGWQAPPAWSIAQGQLQAESNDTTAITVPYKPTVTNYAVEATIRVAQLLQASRGGDFTLFVKPVPQQDGVQAGVNNLMGPGPRPNGSHPQTQIFIDPMSSMDNGEFRPIDYEPRAEWHTYRIEIQGNQASYFIDGTLIATVYSTQTKTLSQGPIGLSCTQVVLQVKNLRITAL